MHGQALSCPVGNGMESVGQNFKIPLKIAHLSTKLIMWMKNIGIMSTCCNVHT